MGSHGSRRRYESKSKDIHRSSGRSRRRSSRSSSESKSRSSSRSSDSRDKRWRRDRYRDSIRSKQSQRVQREDTKPSYPKIILKNLPNTIVEENIKQACSIFNTTLRNINIFKNESGNECVAIIEFEEYDQSDIFIDNSMGVLNILGNSYHIRYATSKEEREYYHKSNSDDNYDSYEDNQRFKIEDSQPCNVLIVKGLDVNTTEEEVRSAVCAITPTIIYDVRLIKDKSSTTSRGFCFVEMGTTADATALLNVMKNQNPPFTINGRRTAVGYARNSFGIARPASKANSVASNAIAAARAAQVSVTPYVVVQPQTAKRGVYAGSSSQAVINDKPNLKHDPYTGYYIDTISGMYYDPNSNLYYNPYDQKYYSYDETTKNYTPYVYPHTSDSSNLSNPNNKNDKDKVNNSLPSKDAKRIAKDMERWAKRTNTVTLTKSIIQKQQIQEVQLKHQKVVDLQNKIEAEESFINLSTTNKLTSEIKEKAILDETLETDHHVNIQALACLLCQRKFSSRETLTKHVLSSKLHLTNLEKMSQIPK